MKDNLTFVLLGQVDHGKSTVAGRLLQALGRIPEDKIADVKRMCERRGMRFEWSFVLDALQTERDQGITLDITQVWFSTAHRRFCLVDAPGHREFLHNMFTGAASADAALVVIDASEGFQEAVKRHLHLLTLLGIAHAIIAINKMDAVGWKQERFDGIAREAREYMRGLSIDAHAIIPLSAREGEGLVSAPPSMAWYTGPSVLEALESIPHAEPHSAAPLRFTVQDVYKFDAERVIAGKVESGIMKQGDELLFSLSGARARIARFVTWPSKEKTQASAGEMAAITLTEPIFVERGQVASAPDDAPMLTNLFRARIFWMGQHPLVEEQRLHIRIGTAEMNAELREIEGVVDTETLALQPLGNVSRYGIAEVIIRPKGLVAVDAFRDIPETGRFVILEEGRIAGAGVIDLTGFADQRVKQDQVKSQYITPYRLAISPNERARKNGHTGGVLWFTGLSGAGKTTLALALQEKLFASGCQVCVLDGDNIRKGLNRDLGFSPEDRQENLRRAGEVAALFAEAGFIVITAFISPTHADRIVARAGYPEGFHSVYIKSDVALCERRDVKGLYRKAREGIIKEFTGVSAPYEEPTNPDLVINTLVHDVDACVRQLMRYTTRQFIDPVRTQEQENNAGLGI